MQKQVWFITGCSTGFGRLLCELLLEQGQSVVATARNIDQLRTLTEKAKLPEQLLLLPLDVTQKTQIKTAVETAIHTFGRIDVLVNNAGYGCVGALEEVPDSEIRAVFETNVFGLFEVTRQVLPQMRKQNSGHIMNLSSVSGMVGTAGASIYAATKFAVEGHSEALAGEVASFNIKVTLIEPGAFRTDFANRSLHVAPYMDAYKSALAQTRNYYETIGGKQPGNPVEAAKLMIEVAQSANPPLRLPMGKIALQRIHLKLDQYLNEIRLWENKALATDFDS
jgi:NADP-dependent 3-hydroxy acid dehydrogenase YdfG